MNTDIHVYTQRKEKRKGLDLATAIQRLNQEAFIKNLMHTECWTCLLMSTMLSVLKKFVTLCRRQTDRWVVMIQKPIYPWRVKTLDRVQRIIAQRGWEFRDSVQADTMPGDGRGFTSRTHCHRSHSACLVTSGPSGRKITNRAHAKLVHG